MVQASDIILVIITIILPPAGVLAISGCSCDFLINVCLTILGYFPGHIHAFWLIYKKMKAEELYGIGGYRYIGNGTYEPLTGAPVPPTYYGSTNHA